jgi:hypothetical protein
MFARLIAISGNRWERQPRRAASIAAMSIFVICIIASNALGGSGGRRFLLE